MSAVLFGVTEEARDKMMMRVVDKLVELNWQLFPAEQKARPKGGHFWFSWNKRGCMYYVTELPLRLLAHHRRAWWPSTANSSWNPPPPHLPLPRAPCARGHAHPPAV